MASRETKKLLHDTARLLAFHQALGIDRYPRLGLEGFLALTDPQPRPLPLPASSPALLRRASVKPQPPPPTPQPAIPQDLTLAEIQNELQECKRCGLHADRSHIVFGSERLESAGKQRPIKLFIIGDQPDASDDLQGTPFTGEAGILLERMLHAINLRQDEVYLANLLKCRPADDRAPTAEEIRTCLPFLVRQILTVSPQVICVMGTLAGQALLNTKDHLFKIRGRFHDFRGIKMMITFSPAMLLKNTELKKGAWQDLQIIQRELAKIPARI